MSKLLEAEKILPFDPALVDPFGKAGCQQEIDVLKERYVDYYFFETPFNLPAISPYSYLISGRRGSGKTALAKFFAFQKLIPDSRCIEIDEPRIYHRVLSTLSNHQAENREYLVPRLAQVWDVVVWLNILDFLKQEEPEIAGALTVRKPKSNGLSINDLFRKLRDLMAPSQIGPNTQDLMIHLEGLSDNPQFIRAKEVAANLCSKRPLLIPIDTLEKYELSDDSTMLAVSALVEFSARFHAKFQESGLHIKTFLAGESFPHLMESFLLNPLKSVNHPVFLLWRSKDLLRLICWRLYKRLESSRMLLPESRQPIHWDDYDQVLERMWVPYFGKTLVNRRGLSEDTFSYVLRHTQMRPRQLITICNSIAFRSLQAGRFPRLSEEDIREGVQNAEKLLAFEIFNSYDSVYPRAARIVEMSLRGIPLFFKGSELDRRARKGASEWHRKYSMSEFRELVAALGVVGRVKRKDESAGYLDAEFEYSTTDRLAIGPNDECVIHPMFFERLEIKIDKYIRVMPFTLGKVNV